MYYKTIKSNLTFNEAIDSFKNRNIIKLGSYRFDPKNMNINDIKFSIDQITSDKWEVLVYDNDMNGRLEEVRDMMHDINLNIDKRFHNEDVMNIESYWNLFNDLIVICDDVYIPIWARENEQVEK